MTASPPRPREPFPVATDYAEPIPLIRTANPDVPVTNEHLSQQMGALDARIGAMHRDVALTRTELGELRGLVVGDHAPRITAVERGATLGGTALKIGQWGLVATGVLGVAAQVASMFKPELVGPLQSLIGILGGLQ